MQATGCVDMVSFGAEDEQAQLQKVLSVLLSPEFEPVFRLRLMGGGSYAAARSQTVEDLAGEETACLLYTSHRRYEHGAADTYVLPPGISRRGAFGRRAEIVLRGNERIINSINSIKIRWSVCSAEFQPVDKAVDNV